MKPAISNIAWPHDADMVALDLMVSHGVGGIEIVPEKVWTDPLAATDSELETYSSLWRDRGVEIVALRPLLHGTANLSLFANETTRLALTDYVAQICRAAEIVGAPNVIFGSPQNRKRGDVGADEAREIAVEFFAILAAAAADSSTTVCLEPCPAEYGCDFVVSIREALELIEAVGHPSLRLHVDAAAASLEGPGALDAIAGCGDRIRHVHISEVGLDRVGMGRVDHVAIAAALRSSGYDGWATVEMKHDPDLPLENELRRVFGFVRATYVT